MKIAICDDESFFRNVLQKYIDEYSKNSTNVNNIEISISQFSCGEDLISSYESGNTFDVIFLDVEMKNLSGVQAGHLIRKYDNNVMLIFTTSFTDYVPEAFALNAFQFLTKPIRQDRFNKEFDRAIGAYTKKKYKYRISTKTETIFLEVKDILFIETYNRHLRVITKSGKYECSGKMSAEEKKLAQYDFVRCHQGYIVNLNCIQKINKNTVVLTSGDEIAISKYLKNDVMTAFNRFVSGCCV